MKSQTEVSVDDHTQWFDRAIVSDAVHLFIFQCFGKPIAHTRLQMLDEDRTVAEVSIINSPRMSGLGIGKTVLSQTLHQGWNIGIKQVVAVVHKDNAASIRLFQESGFLRTSCEGDFIRLQKGQ